MRHPQVINLEEDSVIAIDGLSVLDDDTGEVITGPIELDVNIWLYDQTAGGGESIETPITMAYQSDYGFWTINISDILSILNDRRRYVAQIVPDDGESFRPFKLEEFATDNETIERGSFEVFTTGDANSKIKWSDTSGVVYEAPLYTGGDGTNYPTSPEEITHRGAIVDA